MLERDPTLFKRSGITPYMTVMDSSTPPTAAIANAFKFMHVPTAELLAGCAGVLDAAAGGACV